jgi:phosphoglycerate dehydrogenase-like enzyme
MSMAVFFCNDPGDFSAMQTPEPLIKNRPVGSSGTFRKIVVPDCMGDQIVYNAFAKRLPAMLNAKIHFSAPRNNQDMIDRIQDADCIVHFFEGRGIDSLILQTAQKLKYIFIAGPLGRSVDVVEAENRGIRVFHTPHTTVQAVAEMTIACMLYFGRDLNIFSQSAGNPPLPYYAPGIFGKKLGLIGLGAIGQKVAQIARGLGMDILAWSPNLKEEVAQEQHARKVLLPFLMENSDFISLHLRLSEKTTGIITRDHLDLMKKTAYFINTARGALVNEDHLFQILKTGNIAGAALDVFSDEPVPPDSPWRKLGNVLITPHVAWRTIHAVETMIGSCLNLLLSFLEQEFFSDKQ